MTEAEDAPAMTDPDGPGADAEEAQTALNELPDGSGCAEIWDYLSDRRRED